jgi:16S rRNA G966 N2-methylase RsmD
LWLLGKDHRLLCGNALEQIAYRTLLAGEAAQMVFTDPPYNVPIAGHVSGLGRMQHREFAMASGEMRAPEFTGFLNQVFGLLCQHSARASTHFVCMDWRHSHELLDAARGHYQLRNTCVWAKDNAGMGSLYRSQHELVWVFQNGPGRAINNVQLGANGRYRTNVWHYPGLSSFRSGRDQQLEMHPTVKPVALVADAMLDCSRRGGIVLDPFAGSGTTIIAAQRTGRRGFAMEIDPVYVDVAIRRWQEVTGQQAVLATHGRTFTEVAAARREARERDIGTAGQ